MSGESSVLMSSLSSQRDHVLGILEGLPEDALWRPVLPSGWTCLGLVQHLAIDVERFWFRAVVAGEQVELCEGAQAWHVAEGSSPEAVLSLYKQEISYADEIIAATPLETAPAWWPREWPDWRLTSLHAVLLHAIAETACHAGHLDAARELIDGRQWLVLT